MDPEETVVPGTGETPASPPQPSAGDVKTETSGEGPPETIPYPRFKEVNDRYQRLKPIEELEEYGYDVDSLRRLVGFEAQYSRDPLGTMGDLVDRLDISEEAKTAIKQSLEGAGSTPTGGDDDDDEDTRSGEAPPGWAKPLLERYQEDMTAREENARQEVLDSILAEWDRLDKDDQLETPLETKLSYIASNASNGSSAEEIARNARKDALEFRDHVLGSAISKPGPSGSPRSVPGSTVPSSSPQKFESLKDASAAARAAITAGTLPGIAPGELGGG